MQTRPAARDDAEAMSRIYNAGIEERIATFETKPRSPGDVLPWTCGPHPAVVVVENERVIAFASTSAYSPRECYAGIAEFSVYTDPESRGRGAGRLAMEALIREAAGRGYWKLLSSRTPPAWPCSAPSASARSASTTNTPASTAPGATWSS